MPRYYWWLLCTREDAGAGGGQGGWHGAALAGPHAAASQVSVSGRLPEDQHCDQHYLHTIYTLSIHCLHTIYTPSIHYLYTIYTLSIHSIFIYTQAITSQQREVIALPRTTIKLALVYARGGTQKTFIYILLLCN